MKEKASNDQNNETQKSEPKTSPTLDANTIVALASSLGRVSQCLIMCAPQFAEGSEGAVSVDLARSSIKAVNNIIQSFRDVKGKGDEK